MNTHVPIDNDRHRDLRVALRYGADVGDAINQVLVFPAEFEQVQREYPILIRRTDEGVFYAVALLGFMEDDNLFLDGDRWDARYVPAMRQRGPFAPAVAGATDEPTVLHIDMSDPRVGAVDGEPLFLRHGGHAPYHRHIANVLDVIRVGHRTMATALRDLAEAGLLHSTSINVELGDGQTVVIGDIMVITRERLAALDAAPLERLSRSGLLYIAHMAAASLENVSHLIGRHQRKHGLAT